MISPVLTDDDKVLYDHYFLDAEAKIKIEEEGKTEIEIEVEGAVPKTFYTAWLKLAGSSPLTGTGATPLAPTTELDDLSMSTSPKPGSTDVVNGFFTDEDGEGERQRQRQRQID